MSLGYILRRIAQSIAALFALMVVVFVLVRATGSPVNLYLPLDAPQAIRDEMTVRLGLDQPVYVQFWKWFVDALHFDLGTSLWQNKPAIDVVLTALPNTLMLGLVVLVISSLLAILIGSLAAFRPNGWFDRLAGFVSLAGASIPDFWLALMGILLFAVTLGLLPTSGSGNFRYWILPVAVLTMRPLGTLVQVVRGSMISALGSQYVRTARAKGAPERRVIFIHALRNGLLPALTVAGDLAAQFAGGVTVVEVVFGWPGIGKLMIDAILNRDFAVLQAGILCVAAVIVTLNILVDLAYAAIDPRIQIQR
jgi:peptide/nickel transport system permease protein